MAALRQASGQVDVSNSETIGYGGMASTTGNSSILVVSGQQGLEPSSSCSASAHATSKACTHEFHQAVMAEASEKTCTSHKLTRHRRAATVMLSSISYTRPTGRRASMTMDTAILAEPQASRQALTVETSISPKAQSGGRASTTEGSGSGETPQSAKRPTTRHGSLHMPPLGPASQASVSTSSTEKTPTSRSSRHASMGIDTSKPSTRRAGRYASLTIETPKVADRGARSRARTTSSSPKSLSGGSTSTTTPDCSPKSSSSASTANQAVDEGSCDTGTAGHARQKPAVNDVLLKYSFEWGIPSCLMKEAHNIFSEIVELPGDGSGSSVVDAKLEHETFSEALCRLTQTDDPNDLPDGLVQSAFALADKDQDHMIDFKEFVMWYCENRFSESLLCSKSERELRALARKYSLTIVDIEKLKNSFDRFDEDGSGAIDLEEFENVLRVLMKIPSHIQIPPNRVRQFWVETDIDRSGEVSFEEFLIFYTRYFGNDSVFPALALYRSLRRVPGKFGPLRH